jgi:hypothetical protein
MEQVKVIVRFLDGRVVKGYTQDFNPTRPTFHFRTNTPENSLDTSNVIEVKDLKALFFVKTFEGNKEYNERKEFIPGDRAQGRKVEVTFIDGEIMQGSTVGYDPHRSGFFLLPIDPLSNNIRIFVTANAVVNFRFLS